MKFKSKKKINEIDSVQCFETLKIDNKAKLIDVRTKAEWQFVGVPDLSLINKNTFFVSWQIYPSLENNKFFADQISQIGIKKDDHLYFICRSGQRSLYAAIYLQQKGYIHCSNVKNGFEGNKDLNHQRSKINGWKFNLLPWKQ